MNVTIKRGLAGSKQMHHGICGFHIPEYINDTNDMVLGYPLLEIIYGFTQNKNAFTICDKCWEELKKIVDSPKEGDLSGTY